jgi:hypothetical protein
MTTLLAFVIAVLISTLAILLLRASDAKRRRVAGFAAVPQRRMLQTALWTVALLPGAVLIAAGSNATGCSRQ